MLFRIGIAFPLKMDTNLLEFVEYKLTLHSTYAMHFVYTTMLEILISVAHFYCHQQHIRELGKTKMFQILFSNFLYDYLDSKKTIPFLFDLTPY